MTTPRCLPSSHQVAMRRRFTYEGARRLSCMAATAEPAGRAGTAGTSNRPDVTANDPALLTSTRAFTAELEAVAPSSVAGPWQVLGRAVITVVESGGDSTTV